MGSDGDHDLKDEATVLDRASQCSVVIDSNRYE